MPKIIFEDDDIEEIIKPIIIKIKSGPFIGIERVIHPLLSKNILYLYDKDLKKITNKIINNEQDIEFNDNDKEIFNKIGYKWL